MNVYDAERMGDLVTEAGYREATGVEEVPGLAGADVGFEIPSAPGSGSCAAYA